MINSYATKSLQNLIHANILHYKISHARESTFHGEEEREIEVVGAELPF
jgi:hypothetical protein